MREYSKVAPQFWTGKTGKTLRSLGKDELIVALYLITCPSANMLGLYYLPLPTLCHETGLSLQGASKALRRVFEGGFAAYNHIAEYVWVYEMARFQIGEALDAKDHRVKGIRRELESLRSAPFFNEFIAKYQVAFHLSELSPSKGASKPLRSQEQEQEQEIEQERTNPHSPLSGACVRSDAFAEVWSQYPNPVGRKAAERHFRASVKTLGDVEDIRAALARYVDERNRENIARKARDMDPIPWQNGSTWFNNWRDWVPDAAESAPGKGAVAADIHRPTGDVNDFRPAKHLCGGWCGKTHEWECDDFSCDRGRELLCPQAAQRLLERKVGA